ncbi:hypothetical protein LVJ94_34215 [Pendulispora rubella]|uniref:Uncharacterized protein n=1 Tax=Pendulispora rubella TaxID=2741070 RepID=A0ABZ2KV52_9BACT
MARTNAKPLGTGEQMSFVDKYSPYRLVVDRERVACVFVEFVEPEMKSVRQANFIVRCVSGRLRPSASASLVMITARLSRTFDKRRRLATDSRPQASANDASQQHAQTCTPAERHSYFRAGKVTDALRALGPSVDMVCTVPVAPSFAAAAL